MFQPEGAMRKAVVTEMPFLKNQTDVEKNHA